MAVCKRAVSKRGILKCPVSHVLNFRGWISLIYDKITLIHSVKNTFNPTSEVQNIENGAFQNVPFTSSHFPNRDYSCLWAILDRFLLQSWSSCRDICLKWQTRANKIWANFN